MRGRGHGVAQCRERLTPAPQGCGAEAPEWGEGWRAARGAVHESRVLAASGACGRGRWRRASGKRPVREAGKEPTSSPAASSARISSRKPLCAAAGPTFALHPSGLRVGWWPSGLSRRRLLPGSSAKSLRSQTEPRPAPHLGPGCSDVRLHPPLQGPAGVGALRRGLGVVGGAGRGLARLVELHVAVLLAAAADAAVALRVQERAAVAERAPLELPFAQLDGRAACAQHEPLPVVVEAALAAQRAVDVGEGHARGHALPARGAQVRLAAGQRDGGGRVVLLEGVDAVVAVGGVLQGPEGEPCHLADGQRGRAGDTQEGGRGGRQEVRSAAVDY